MSSTHDTVSPVRVVVAVVVAAVVCAVGALILGEYQFSGLTPYVTGVLLGLVVSEFVLEIAKARHPALGALTGLLVAGSLGWAAWISSGEGLRPFPAVAWISMGLGGVVAGVRTGRRTRTPVHRTGDAPDVTTAE